MNTRIVKEIVAGGILVGIEAFLLYGHGHLLSRNVVPSSLSPTANTVSYAPVTKLASVQSSQNWAGYEVNSGTYQSVSASWQVPELMSARGVAAQWIGLGGVNSRDLLQTGTIEQQTANGPTADVFVEKLPDHAQNIMTVPIGSTITASIAPAGPNQWNLSITANYQGQTRTKTVTMNVSSQYAQGMETSAEWIFEDPANTQGSLYHLARTQPVTFSHVEANDQAITSANALIMTGPQGQARVEPTLMKQGAFTTEDVRGPMRQRYLVHPWQPGSGVIWQGPGASFSISGPGFSITESGYGPGFQNLGSFGSWSSPIQPFIIQVPWTPWQNINL
ncbi:G1 family glutamic endopeptidase [Sulfobacillus thermosulfidooxidans]|uniref:G1 family glutamic endopeptidase n=1 Tax=Sulfobacillus thermosulfidooxidans TaxID=28034 RepID=UPI000300EAAF|nr:G1 family glutamic endopeptidase [Sulfobacillus thermosulfidooxidans]